MNKTSFHCFSSSVLVSSVSECSCVHGLCDSGLKGDGRCTCFSQYKGPNCDQGKLLCCCYHHTCTSTCALNPLRLFLSPDTCTFLVSVCYQDPEHPVNPHLSLWELPVPFPWYLPSVSELPECAALSCEQNSRCMEEALTGKLVCQCLPGYEKSGSQCICEFIREQNTPTVTCVLS